MNAIVAIGKYGCIGRNNTIPWKCKEDMAYFKESTLNKTVIMGRKTWESLYVKPLPHRRNIVITNNPESHRIPYVDMGVEFVRFEDIDPYNHQDSFVIGGLSIYNLFNKYINRYYVSNIDEEVESCDCYFPDHILNDFSLISAEKLSDKAVVKLYGRSEYIRNSVHA